MAGIVLEQQGVLARTALVARLVTIIHQVAPKGVTTRDGARGALNLLQGSVVR
jgi:hypothetical protein